MELGELVMVCPNYYLFLSGVENHSKYMEYTCRAAHIIEIKPVFEYYKYICKIDICPDMYWRIDNLWDYNTIKKHLDDIKGYCSYIKDYRNVNGENIERDERMGIKLEDFINENKDEFLLKKGA